MAWGERVYCSIKAAHPWHKILIRSVYSFVQCLGTRLKCPAQMLLQLYVHYICVSHIPRPSVQCSMNWEYGNENSSQLECLYPISIVRMLPLEPFLCAMHGSHFLSLFSVAQVEETIFCMHGGLSPDLKSLNQVCEHTVTVTIPLCTSSYSLIFKLLLGSCCILYKKFGQGRNLETRLHQLIFPLPHLLHSTHSRFRR